MSSPTVSVIIPAYNAAHTLGACLRSVVTAQYDGSVDLIVVDDASTDDTVAIAESFEARIVRRETGGSPAAARNAGAKIATGEILIFVDADTEMRHDTMQAGVVALQKEGVGAVTGMYEPEPINDGFFPRYYAYLKHHAFTKSDTDHIGAFGAQCGAITKKLFDELGGFRPIPWGMDVENDEFGARINERATVALSREFRVRHNFPTFGKLLYVFTSRVYWWVLFSESSHKTETVLMTNGFGWSTAAMATALLITPLAAMADSDWPGRWLTVLGLVGLFIMGYAGFWRYCFKRQGLVFAITAAVASACFAVLITYAAARGYVAALWWAIRNKKPPFARIAAEQA